jgi:hypothetical protein
MHDVMTHGLFGVNGVYQEYGTEMLDGRSIPVNGPTIEGALELLDMIGVSADEVKVPIPSLDAYRDRLLGAFARGHGDQSWTLVNEEQARASGL